MDIEKAKEELSEESKKIATELENKSEDEIKAMEEAARTELLKQVTLDAKEYVYNLLNLGQKQFSEEVFEECATEISEANKNKLDELYSNIDETTGLLHESIINIGYSLGGKQFIKTIIESDPESAKVVLETAIQLYMKLRDAIENRASEIVASILGEMMQNAEVSKEEEKEAE